jgi:GNAT superfamily N-acetyltransferase
MTVSKVETNPADFSDFAALHALLSTAFAYMAARIDPPSSLTRMSVEDLRAKSGVEDLFLIRDNEGPVACLFGSAQAESYYVGKLAVAAPQRGQGLARALIEEAGRRAAAMGLAWLELQTRVELVENHAAFAALGFVETGRTSHPGHARPTSVTMRRPVRS